MTHSDGFSAWRPTVWVFVPYVSKDGRLESADYDIPAYRDEVGSWFDTIGLPWQWVPITIENVASVVDRIRQEQPPGSGVVLNLCDGNELDGSPGVSVVRALERAGIPYSGGAPEFYAISTYKVPMKARLIEHGVRTAPYVPLTSFPDDIATLEATVGYPAFIKPEVSAGSGGIALTSLVRDANGVMARVAELLAGEDGDFYRSSGLFAEAFLDGPEFTVFVIGDRTAPCGVRAYPAVQRIFHSALPAAERFLSYDRYWSEYKEESRLPEGEPFYRYGLAPADLQDRLTDLAIRAFLALDGTGYGRVDIRLDERTSQLYVLEVNSNCGLSGDRETSVGELLHLTGTPAHQLVSEILHDAFDRWAVPARPGAR